MYKLILFDFDGTIANTLDVGLPIYNQLAKKYNFVEIKSIEEITKFNLIDSIKSHKISKIKFPFYLREFLKLLNKNIENVKIYDGMKEVIRKLNKDYKLGIISANSKENITKFLEMNDLKFCFDFVYNYPLLFGKSKVFKKILKSKKLNKKDIIYIGDEVRDVMAANKTEIDIIAVTWGINNKNLLQTKKPKFIAEKPIDILKYFYKN